LDPHSSDAAVKLAIAETTVIEETKHFLKENGVDLEAAGDDKRSDTVIFVKNFSYGTTEAELRVLFEAHAMVKRVLMVPAKTFAIVELASAPEAKVAFQKLAYKRLGESVIFLEWAPNRIVKGPSADTSVKRVKAPVTVPVSEKEEPVEIGSSLYIKNLSFSTTSLALSNIFKTFPDFVSAQVQTRVDSKGGQVQSLGYGFAHFRTVPSCERALKAMQSFVLDGHSLVLNYAKRDPESKEEGHRGQLGLGGKSNQTKLLVKNVPFESTRKDLLELFKAYGSVERVRLPKKLDRTARGFAFVDFTTHGQAKQAMESLKHTHYLGRHLVIIWAEESQNVEVLRSKTSDQFDRDQGSLGSKKKRQRLQLDNEDR